MKKIFARVCFVVNVFTVPVSIGTLIYFIHRTRTVEPLEIEIKLAPVAENEKDFAIATSSLEEITELYEKRQNEMSMLFEKERSRLIELFTVLSVLSAVFSLLGIGTGFFEKYESEKVNNDLEKLKEDYSQKLEEIAFENWLDTINSASTTIQETIGSDNRLVINDRNATFVEHNDNNGFKECVSKYNEELFGKIGTHKEFLKDEKIFSQFTIRIENYMVSVLNYCKEYLKLEKELLRFTVKNDYIRDIVSSICDNSDKDFFKRFKGKISEMVKRDQEQDFNWGEF